MASFEELDYQRTELGELILRRRTVPSLGGTEVYEVKLGGQFLMSSLVNQAEIALARLALEMLVERDVRVLVGGLGLGYTAQAALEFDRVTVVDAVEFLAEVIRWHEKRLVPPAGGLLDDPRCNLIHGDITALVDPWGTRTGDSSFASRQYDAILLDVDHSPEALLQPIHESLYSESGLEKMGERLAPGGVYALWSADPPEEAFLNRLRSAFSQAWAREVEFFNPLLNEKDANTIYLARKG